jgi:hypothetical protein
LRFNGFVGVGGFVTLRLTVASVATVIAIAAAAAITLTIIVRAFSVIAWSITGAIARPTAVLPVFAAPVSVFLRRLLLRGRTKQ